MTPTDLYTERMWRIILGGCAIAAFCAALFLSSCHTAKSDTAKLSKIDYRHPTVPAAFCASKYPPRDSVHERTEYIQGEDVVMLDTVTEDRYISDTTIITRYITKTVTNPNRQ